MNCTGSPNTGFNCTIACNSGFSFDRGVKPYYECGPTTLFLWDFKSDDNPNGDLPTCNRRSILKKDNFWNDISLTKGRNKKKARNIIDYFFMKIIQKRKNTEIKISRRLWVVMIQNILICFNITLKNFACTSYLLILSCTGKQRTFGELQSTVRGSLLWRRK